MPGGARIPVATNVVLNSKGKEGVLDLPANGNYQIDMKQTGFIDKTIMITVNATMDNEEIERIVVMIPDLPPEETQILMSWETDPPADVDIYVAAINNADDSICVVYFDNRNCPGAAAQQIRDNAEGGDNGPETVSLTRGWRGSHGPKGSFQINITCEEQLDPRFFWHIIFISFDKLFVQLRQYTFTNGYGNKRLCT